MDVGAGRRERKKAETRCALSKAAMRLALEHGVDNVTAEGIAMAADVAPRTFHNYFASKEEAIVGELVDRATGFADALRARPAGEPIWDSLQHAVVAMLSKPPEEGLADQVTQMRMLKSSRLLLAQQLTVFEQVHRVLVAAVAERTRTDRRKRKPDRCGDRRPRPVACRPARAGSQPLATPAAPAAPPVTCPV
jgi:AcrR family transcriptional regulator